MPGAAKKPRERRWGNPQKQIERAARQIKEELWYKKPREDLVKASLPKGRKRKRVFARFPTKGETMDVHFHRKGFFEIKGVRALPSGNDLMRFFREIFKPKLFSSSTVDLRTMVISRTGPLGKERGRLIIKATKRFKRLDFEKDVVPVLEKYAGKRYSRKNLKEVLKLLDDLKQFGLLYRFVPMPGYRFDGEKCDFVRIRRGERESEREEK
jgi:hypothetical protein